MGIIPSSIVNIPNLAGSVDYNGLWSSDQNTLGYMEVFFPGYENTQTVAPANVTVSELASGTATLSWDYIPFRLESADRVSGIRVSWVGSVNVGDQATIASAGSGHGDGTPRIRTSPRCACSPKL